MVDRATVDLLRQTARDALAGPPADVDPAALGWYGLLVPEGHGGAGWCPSESCIVAEETGRTLSPVPWAHVAVAAAALASSPEGADLLPGVLDGTTAAALMRHDGRRTATLLEGPCVLRTDAETPDVCVCIVDGAGCLVATGDRGAVRVGEQPFDLDSTRTVRRVGFTERAAVALDPAAFRRISDAAVLLCCADTAGAVASASEVVVRHLVDRQAFGRPLASFQVLQHRLVDLSVFVTTTRILVERAAALLAEDPDGASSMVDAANVHVHSRAVAVLDDCIQLAGGIGYTWDLPLHHAMRRATSNATLYRSWQDSAERYVATRGWTA